jgi:Fe-S-cluster containining protein
MSYFKCTGAGKRALCCNGVSLALTLYEATKFWKYFPIIYQITGINLVSNGFLIEGNLTAYIPPDKSCPFLQDNLCSIYENRPSICRLFPLNFSFIYRKFLFKPFKENKYKIEDVSKIYPPVKLDILCKKCDTNSISNNPKEGYIPFTKLIEFVDSELIRKDLEYQQHLLIFILQQYPLTDDDLSEAYKFVGLQGYLYNFFTTQIINLGFLYALSIIGKIDFENLLETQINLLKENPIYNKEKTQIFINSYKNLDTFSSLFKKIQEFIKQNPYKIK